VVGNTIEHVEQTDKYVNEKKFGRGLVSYTFRITYRSLEKTLTNEEVNKLHAEVEKRTGEDFGAEIRLA
jgi:phenylalanyl-tRNA synthetase alpha chain